MARAKWTILNLDPVMSFEDIGKEMGLTRRQAQSLFDNAILKLRRRKDVMDKLKAFMEPKEHQSTSVSDSYWSEAYNKKDELTDYYD